jgi:hypothetical protein
LGSELFPQKVVVVLCRQLVDVARSTAATACIVELARSSQEIHEQQSEQQSHREQQQQQQQQQQQWDNVKQQ